MDRLGDPNNDRVMKDIKPPPHRPLDPKLMFPDTAQGIILSDTSGIPDWKLIRDHLRAEGRIAKPEVIRLIEQASKILRSESNLIRLEDPVTIVGDLHGQFYDLLNILEMHDPSQRKHVFLGDYVDRGYFSCETVILLYALKINYPQLVYLMRGNHESRQMTSSFNFHEEVAHKYDQEVYQYFCDSFDTLPLACVIDDSYLLLHGGISPELVKIEDINRIDRFIEPPYEGLYCDLIWSDPVEDEQGNSVKPFTHNESRNTSYTYNKQALTQFLSRNNLLSLIRAHEVQKEGFKMHTWEEDFPPVITLFSAPNYCDVYGNKGAIIKIDNMELDFFPFVHSEHPFLLPNFGDINSYVLLFIAEQVGQMLYHIMNVSLDDDPDNDEVTEEDKMKFSGMLQRQDSIQCKDKLRNKVKFVSMMMKLQAVKRQENEEQFKELKGACPDQKFIQLMKDKKSVLGDFSVAKKFDSVNEQRPQPQGQQKLA